MALAGGVIPIRGWYGSGVTQVLRGALAAIGPVALTVVACGGEPAQLPPGPATTPPPTTTSPATPTAPPEATPTPSPPATPAPTATPTPQSTATPSPTPVPSTATSSPSPTPTSESPHTTALRYDTYDRTSAVGAPGSYAFLADADDLSTAVTTYEGLRDGTATALLIHTTNADGVSRADVYDAVEVGDLFEWHKADDCFVRYTVTEVKPDPSGTAPRKLLAVEWMTYAFTGCSGDIAPDVSATFAWGSLPDLGGTSLTAPVVHGVYQIVPADWEGSTRASEDYLPPAASYENPVYTTDIAEARNLPHWREPTPPPGWTFAYARSGSLRDPGYGYTAEWRRPGRISGFRVFGHHASGWYYPQESSWHNGASIVETRVIAGRPAYVIYNSRMPGAVVHVLVYDAATESMYRVLGDDYSINSHNLEGVVAIARSLFAEPTPGPTALRYDTYDRTGAVEAPGSYAFLEDADDPASVVTTYEGLRDGTATALLIHTTDADGVSRGDVYDAVEAGDLFEWREADDCWVRYVATSLPTAVSGTAPRTFVVRAFTDSYAGCNGAILAERVRSISWAPPAISSRALTAPVRHGAYHLIPAGWTGPVADSAIAPVPDDIEAVRDHRGSPHPFWRPATVPEGWSLAGVTWGGETDPPYGYSAWYQNEHGETGVEILVGYWGGEQYPFPMPVFRDTAWVREPSVIDGHHAVVEYSPVGLYHEPRRLPRVHLFNEQTRMAYLVIAWDPRLAGGDPTTTIEIARSLIEPPAAAR